MFPDEDTAIRWFEKSGLGEWPLLPALRMQQDARCRENIRSPLLLPGMPTGILRSYWNYTGKVKSTAPKMGIRHLFRNDQSQGCLQHETTPRLENKPEDCLVHAPPYQGIMGSRMRGAFSGAGRG